MNCLIPPQIDDAAPVPLDRAILSPEFVDADLRTMLEVTRSAADTFAQGARYQITARREALNGWDRLDQPHRLDRAPDERDPQTRRLLADLDLAQVQFCTRLREALATGRLRVAARKDDRTAVLEPVDRKVWASALPRLGIGFGLGAVTYFSIDAWGPGVRFADLHLLAPQKSGTQELSPKGQAALAALIANHDRTRLRTYFSAKTFCRGTPFKCSEREAREVWRALPDEFKLLNRQGYKLTADERSPGAS